MARPDSPPTGDGDAAVTIHSAACFVCATNRPCTGVDGLPLEELMHNNDCAAMWKYPPDMAKRVRSLEHMKRVEAGDLIFMFASGGVGIIAVGRATADCEGPLLPGQPHRLRPAWTGEEWRVPVTWLRWQPDDPCPSTGWNATFYEITGPSDTWDERREAVLAFFGLV
jgi:hypothetical protein